MELAYIISLLLVAPYFCSGNMLAGLAKGGASDTTPKDKCPTYSCMKDRCTECQNKLANQDKPIIVSDSCLCEMFDLLLSADKLTEAAEKQLTTIYLPFLCCLLEKFGIVKCGFDNEGKISNVEVAKIESVTDLTKLKLCSTTTIPLAEIADPDVAVKLLEKLKEIPGKCEDSESHEGLRLCMGGFLSAVNEACDKQAERTFCPNRTETYAKAG